jgi:hypothetical protein
MNYKIKNISNGDVKIPYSNTNEVIISDSMTLLLSMESIKYIKGLSNLIYQVNIDNLILYLGEIELSKDDSVLYIGEIGNKISMPDTKEYKVANTTSNDSAVDSIMKSYYIKESDGKDFYRKKRAQLVNKLNNPLTEEDVMLIESKLSIVKSELLTGDWITAKRVVIKSVVEDAYTQTIKDEYLAEITTYINNNY